MGGFALLSLFYVLVGIPVVRRLVTNRRATFDRRFTPEDRALVQQAAFFLLVPVSVALHELGHAVAVWSFGGRVTDFGFYVFAGFVAYREPFSDAQEIVVALAGPLVNVFLSAGAIAAVLLKKPPLRAAYNELLLQFALLSGVNALVFYPVLDLVSSLDGDWRQMYFGGEPAISVAILIAHASILGGSWWAWRLPSVRERINILTGLPGDVERGPLGGLRRSPAARAAIAGTPAGKVFAEGAVRVRDGWPEPTEFDLRREGDRTFVVIHWHGAHHAVFAVDSEDGAVTIYGAIPRPGSPDLDRRVIRRLPAPVTPDALTLELRLAMEAVDAWEPTVAP